MERCHWKDSPSEVSHGFLIQRTILTKSDPSQLGKPGSALKHIKSFARGYLEPRVSTLPETHNREQEVFYVAAGKGVFEGGGLKREIGEGDAIFVPAGMEHAFRNTSDDALELLLLREELPGAVKSDRRPVIKNYRNSPITTAHWVYLVHRLFDERDGLKILNSVLVVTIEPMQAGDQHSHPPGTDEIWYALRGSAVHIVGKEMCIQSEGDVVACVPETENHTLINYTDKPFKAFYFAHIPKR